MVEVTIAGKKLDVPFTVYLRGVTKEMFDELANEDVRAELIDGVMIVPSPASPRHDRVAGFVRSLLWNFAEGQRLGQVFGPDALIHLASCRKFAPDGFFLETSRVPTPLPEDELDVIPNLLFEVLPPSTRNDDLHVKRPAFRQAGVEEMWFIDIDNEQIIADRKLKRRYRETTVTEGRLTSSALPGFWLDVGWLWAEPLPNFMACLQEILR